MNCWKCPDGKPHQWVYLGRAAQAYRCSLCLEAIRKEDLKRLTDQVVEFGELQIELVADA